MPIDRRLAALARSILEEQVGATIQPNPFAQWKRWSRRDPEYALAVSIADGRGVALDRREMDLGSAILTVAEDAFERYGRTPDHSLIASINDLLETTLQTFRSQLPASTAEYCAAQVALVAISSEVARQRQDDAFRAFWATSFTAYALEHLEEIRSLPELGEAWQAVDLAVCYAARVVGLWRRVRNSRILRYVSAVAGEISGQENGGFEGAWWRVEALDTNPDPSQAAFGLSSVLAATAADRFLAIAPDSDQPIMATVDHPGARWSIQFVTLWALRNGHALIRNMATGLCLTTAPEPDSPAITVRVVEESEYSSVDFHGREFTWMLE